LNAVQRPNVRINGKHSSAVVNPVFNTFAFPQISTFTVKMAHSSIVLGLLLLLAIVAFVQFQSAQADPSELGFRLASQNLGHIWMKKKR
jgi:hypothetical protein